MGARQPVPSRAALNALRGVFFTTSCSVILLAEERRRRLQIARAAIENGRKLHTIQSHRGSVALIEAHGSWELRHGDVNDEVLSMAILPRPRTSTRRKSRSHLIGGLDEGIIEHESESDGLSYVVRADENNASYKQSSAKYSVGRGLDRVEPNASKSNSLRMKSLHGSESPASQTSSRSQKVRSSLNESEWPLEANLPETQSGVAASSLSQEDSSVEAVRDNGGTRLADLARSYLQGITDGGIARQHLHSEAASLLHMLLQDLRTRIIDVDTLTKGSETITPATEILEAVSSSAPPSPIVAKQLQLEAIRILEASALHCPEKLTDILRAVLPMTKDPVGFLVQFANIILHGNHCKALRQTLAILKHSPGLPPWACGSLICCLLARHQQTSRNFEKTKKFYLMLQDVGLFRDFDLSRGAEYKIRRFMAASSYRNKENILADAELQKLVSMAPEAVLGDVGLQKYVIARKASEGEWIAALEDIKTLAETKNVDCPKFQSLLTNITDIYSQTHNPCELETFIHKMTLECRLTPKSRWIYTILDEYAREQRFDSVFSWLKFCNDAGASMDAVFHEKFLARCRKYWNFSAKTVQRLQQRLLAGSRSSRIQTHPVSARTSDIRETDKPNNRLRQRVMQHLTGTVSNLRKAMQQIQAAHAKGQDVSAAITPVILARLDLDHDPSTVIRDALQLGLRVHDSAFNKAAQALSAMGDHQAAASMCALAARENGRGDLLYNQFNFANLVFAYTGSARYQALQSVLSSFTSQVRWWHGSRTCKESIKLAMKTAAMRAVAHPGAGESHRRALHELDDALLHVKRCRLTRDDRRTVSEAYVRLVDISATEACDDQGPQDPGHGVHKSARHPGEEMTTNSVLSPRLQPLALVECR